LDFIATVIAFPRRAEADFSAAAASAARYCLSLGRSPSRFVVAARAMAQNEARRARIVETPAHIAYYGAGPVALGIDAQD
jgi:hypothetical protein